MTERQNSLGRAVRLLRSASNKDGSWPASKVWAATFDVEDLTDTVQMLALLDRELEASLRQLQHSPFSPETYETAFACARNALCTGNLSQPWSNGAAQVRNNGVLTILRMCAEFLPEDGRVISQEDLDSIRAALELLRQTVESADLTGELLAFVQEQIELIEQALREYPVVGAKAFDRAVVQAMLSGPEYQRLGEAAGDGSKVRQLIDNAWAKIILWSDRVQALRQLGEAGNSTWNLLGPGGPQ